MTRLIPSHPHLTKTAIACAALVTLAWLFAFIEQQSDVGVGTFGMLDAIHAMGDMAPELARQVIGPLAKFTSGLLTFAKPLTVRMGIKLVRGRWPEALTLLDQHFGTDRLVGEFGEGFGARRVKRLHAENPGRGSVV